MENVLKITSEGGEHKIESTYNPGNYSLPDFVQKDEAYYIHFPGEEVTSAFAQGNDFDQVLFVQLEYENNGVVVRFVTINNEIKASDFTVRVILKKSSNKLSRPEPLSNVLKEHGLDVSKRR